MLVKNLARYLLPATILGFLLPAVANAAGGTRVQSPAKVDVRAAPIAPARLRSWLVDARASIEALYP